MIYHFFGINKTFFFKIIIIFDQILDYGTNARTLTEGKVK